MAWRRGGPCVVYDADFAFYFTSHAEATLSAGRAVARDWSRLRTLQPISHSTNLEEPVFEKEEECAKRKLSAENLVVTQEAQPKTKVARTDKMGSRAVDNLASDKDKAKFIPVLVGVMTNCAPFANRACVDMTRKTMGSPIANPEELSTYSWRRVMPTLGLAAKFSGAEMLALGDWQDKSLGGREGGEAKMPLHYSDNKEDMSKRMKHEAAIILGSIMGFNAWEATPESAYRQARQDAGNQSKLDKVLEEDAVVVWKRPVQFGAGKRGFQLRTAKETQQEPVRLTPIVDLERETFISDMVKGDRSVVAMKMPKMVNKVLSAQDRCGRALCAEFQTGQCHTQRSEECAQGRHVCAILLRSGRVCGQQHMAAECWNRRAISPGQYKEATQVASMRLEEIQKASQAATLAASSVAGQVVTLVEDKDAPNPKPKRVFKKESGWPKRSQKEPVEQSDSAFRRQGEQQESSSGKDAKGGNPSSSDVWQLLDDMEPALEPGVAPKSKPKKPELKKRAGQVWDSVYDKLAKERFGQKGNKYRPEPPTMIAKVREQGGELWLGGLPLEENLPALAEKKFSLQIHCFKGGPEDRVITDDRRQTTVRGKEIPGALVLQLNMDKPRQAQEEWPDVAKVTYSSLHQGDNAYLHCMAGVHRAGLGGPLMRAVLHDESFDKALNTVKAVRQVRPESVIKDFGKARIDAMLGIKLAPPVRTPTGWAEFRTLIHAMVRKEDGGSMPLCTWNQKEEKAGAKGQCSGMLEDVDALDEWMVDVTKSLCTRCRQKMPASFLVKAKALGLG